MDARKIVIAVVLITIVVFGWGAAMAVTGHEAVIAPLAPALGLTVQQVLRTVRSRNATASTHPAAAVPDKEDGAP
ncbi:hypothetical protein SAMN04490357_0260 [Streptomyces misionensis]|uniref:Uncharacterized protein n=1 Tax=Streptomyces misionensis TaxID=67331 RepID=A0A1H4IDZ7_9ACTN|nr:hypothetical protein [Streptomyces misionensis]SEB32160.1 hypothetical protein SAMN04490357_0260 [Streptomyces misionensis]